MVLAISRTSVSAGSNLRSSCSGNPAPVIGKLKNLILNNLKRVAGGGSLLSKSDGGDKYKIDKSLVMIYT